MSDPRIVEKIKRYLIASSQRGETIEVAALLWTIDAQDKLVPSREQINKALAEVPGFQVSRCDGKVLLGSVGDDTVLSQQLFEEAYASYQDVVTQGLKKYS